VERAFRPVYRSLNKPLMLCGVHRKHFFLLVTLGLVLFQLTGALLPAIVLFVPCLIGLRTFARADSEFLRILWMSARFAVRYDPAKAAKGGRAYARPSQSA